MEKSQRWATNADILIDYKNMKITFENVQSIFTRRYFKNLFGVCALFIALTMLFVCAMTDFKSALYFDYLIIGTSGYIGLTIFILSVSIISTCNIRFIRNFGHKIRTRRVKRELRIQNPDGVVVYETKHADPFFDLEYNQEIRDALVTAELKRLKRKHKWSLSRMKRLTITLDGKPKGELVIKEY